MQKSHTAFLPDVRFQRLKGDRKQGHWSFFFPKFGWWSQLPAHCIQTGAHDPTLNTCLLCLPSSGVPFSLFAFKFAFNSQFFWMCQKTGELMLDEQSAVSKQVLWSWEKADLICSHSHNNPLHIGLAVSLSTLGEIESCRWILIWKFPRPSSQKLNRKSLDQRVRVHIGKGCLGLCNDHTRNGKGQL